MSKIYKDQEDRAIWDDYDPRWNTIDGKSKKKAYAFWESNLIADDDIGTTKALQQIHAYIFGGLYDFAGKIRTKTISKGGFTFCLAQYLQSSLKEIYGMPEDTFDEIIDKYITMNMAHPFMEGNGRSTRIWLDLILKKRLKKCVDWSTIDKNEYLDAMRLSVSDDSRIKGLIKEALTDKINDRDVFMKGIDYSYYYEEEEQCFPMSMTSPFGDKVKIKMTPDEIKVMVYALNELRNKLLEENRYTDAVDYLLPRLCDC